MTDKVKTALIAAVAMIVVVGLALYYSPYQTCVRAKSVSIIADVQQMHDEGAANASAAAEAAAMYGSDASGFVAKSVPVLDHEETAAHAKRTAEIICAGAQS